MRYKIKISIFIVFKLIIISYSVAQKKQGFEGVMPALRYQGKYVGGIKENTSEYIKYDKKIDVIVNNKAEFLKAIKSDRKYYSIYIKDNVEIDLSEEGTLSVKTGVKIISGRGVNDSKGALIFTNTPGTYPLFECGSFVEFYGLRIRGDDQGIYAEQHGAKKETMNKNNYSISVSQGIRTQYKNLLVENCELFGWSHTAIMIKGKSANGIIKNNYIHHNRRLRLGYGVSVEGGNAIIEGNLFDYNRHDIASPGTIGSSYTVRNNVFLRNTTSHAVDVHGGKDRGDNTNVAGEYFLIEKNIFVREGLREAFRIRGIPSKKAEFKNNLIRTTAKKSEVEKSVKQKKSFINKFVNQINASGGLYLKGNEIEFVQ